VQTLVLPASIAEIIFFLAILFSSPEIFKSNYRCAQLPQLQILRIRPAVVIVEDISSVSL
jgi:hypothetical protein